MDPTINLKAAVQMALTGTCPACAKEIPTTAEGTDADHTPIVIGSVFYNVPWLAFHNRCFLLWVKHKGPIGLH